MLNELPAQFSFLQMPSAQAALSVIALILAALAADFLFQRVLLRVIFKALRSTNMRETVETGRLKFVPWLAHIIPAIIISEGVQLIIGLPAAVITAINNLAQIFIVMTLAMSITSMLNIMNEVYERGPNANNKPIKGYVQVAKITIYLITAILVIALLVNRSPVILISGLGAAAAVLMFIFQDTLLSLVASVQISSGQLIRIGDWIQMPQLNVDGDVIDIALHTVRVQNWDKTITTIPTKRFINDSFINWRGMRESGGRRIKRSLLIDQNSIHVLTAEQIEELKKFHLLQDYLHNKQQEIERWNSMLAEQGKPTINQRRLTNIGTFRAYVDQYLKNHPMVRQDMLIIARQLEPTANGLPLEVYCFANTIAWVTYESVQSDIFDHLLSTISSFGLQVFQAPSGRDFQALAPNQH